MNLFALLQRKIARIDPPFEAVEIEGDTPGVVGPRFLHVRQYRGLPVSHDPPVRMDATATELSDSLVPVLGAALVGSHLCGGSCPAHPPARSLRNSSR